MPVAIEEKVISDFHGYIDSFNSEDINGVKSHLDENIQIFVNGNFSGEGLDKLLPLWQADMNIHKRVQISRRAICTLKEENSKVIAEVNVELTATVTKEGDEDGDDVAVVNVDYVYDTSSMLQIRHHIKV